MEAPVVSERPSPNRVDAARIVARVPGITPAESEVLRRLLDDPGAHGFALPPDDPLSDAERDLLARVKQAPLDPAPSLHRQVYVILKATRLCNLRCGYCHSWKSGPGQVMSFEVLADTIRRYQSTPGIEDVDYVWHGGETLLLSPDYFEKAIWLQNLFRRPGQRIANGLQTNGTLITDDWARFFAKYRFKVGVSIDGTREIHDGVRLDKKGRGTFAKVEAGLARLREHGVTYGILTVVDERMASLPIEPMLRELKTLGAAGVSLLNSIPDNGEGTERAVERGLFAFPRYVEYLRKVFAIWRRQPEAYPAIREISALIEVLGGGRAGVCTLSGNCMGQFLTIEPSGTVSACDKYLGVEDYTFAAKGASPFAADRLAHARHRQADDDRRMAECRHFHLCKGGCPHDNRMQRIFDADWSGGCCGLSGLIDDIAQWLATDAGQRLTSTRERFA